MGRLIPAGTGMKYYRNVTIASDNTENQKPRMNLTRWAITSVAVLISACIDAG